MWKEVSVLLDSVSNLTLRVPVSPPPLRLFCAHLSNPPPTTEDLGESVTSAICNKEAYN